MVGMLAAPPRAQLGWLVENRLPVDELALQLYDAVPAWFPRLVEAGLLTTNAQSRLFALKSELLSLRDSPKDWTDDGLVHAGGWRRVRELAERALADMC
jgi:hypothetical protein